jgi:hypothetical protein
MTEIEIGRKMVMLSKHIHIILDDLSDTSKPKELCHMRNKVLDAIKMADELEDLQCIVELKSTINFGDLLDYISKSKSQLQIILKYVDKMIYDYIQEHKFDGTLPDDLPPFEDPFTKD